MQLDVVLIEDGLLGGTCLNRGYIPTKTMLRSAEVAHLVDLAAEFGVDVEGDSTTNRVETILVE